MCVHASVGSMEEWSVSTCLYLPFMCLKRSVCCSLHMRGQVALESQDSPVFVSLLTLGALGFLFNNPWLLGQHYSFMQGVSIQTPFLKIMYFKLAYKVVDYHKAFSYILSFGKPSPWTLSYSLVPCLHSCLGLSVFCISPTYSDIMCVLCPSPQASSPHIMGSFWLLDLYRHSKLNIKSKIQSWDFYMRRMYAYAFLSLGYLTQYIFILPFLLQASYFHISLQLSKWHCIPRCTTFSWSSQWLSSRHLGWFHFLDCD